MPCTRSAHLSARRTLVHPWKLWSEITFSTKPRVTHVLHCTISIPYTGFPRCSFINLLVYFRLCWVLVSVRGPSPVAVSRGHSSLRCAGLSLPRPLLLRSTSSRHAGSVVLAHGPSCSAACGILPDQGSNPCPLHWQADSQPLRHQGSPKMFF